MVATIILTVPGILLMIIAGLPAYYVHAKALAWDLRDQPLQPQDVTGSAIPKPWE
jgi:hypothetical protein